MDASGGSGSNSPVWPIVDDNGAVDMNGTMDNLEERIANLEMVFAYLKNKKMLERQENKPKKVADSTVQRFKSSIISYKFRMKQVRWDCIDKEREGENRQCRRIRDTVMSDSEDSTVTYTAVSSPFGGLSDIGSPRVDGPPVMPEDPYAYVVAAFQAPPSPDYVPGPEYSFVLVHRCDSN
ncbi:hypothetical protein Tco_1053883 [Tanacetum coccineum]|uniref:Uncharacterized protein n=1 Tax=Tanacetum coccineum TaxID=301880 RepID=A0ABQ5GWE7_9ASTR